MGLKLKPNLEVLYRIHILKYIPSYHILSPNYKENKEHCNLCVEHHLNLSWPQYFSVPGYAPV